MFASRVTCSRCASQLRPTQARSLGGTGTVFFSSLSEATNPARSPSVQDREDRKDIGHGPNPVRVLDHRKKHPRKPRSYKESHQRSSEKSFFALFNDVVKAGPRHQTSQSSSPPSELEITTRLKKLSDPEARVSPSERVRVFNEDIYPYLKDQPFGVPNDIRAAISRFLTQTCNEMVQQGGSGEAISLSKIGSTFGNLDLSWRNQLVLNICHSLLHRKDSQQGRNLSRGLQELINMWEHISHLGRLSTRKAPPPRFVLPSLEEVLEDITSSAKPNRTQGTDMPSSAKALTSIFLQFPPEEVVHLVPGLLTTIAILSDPEHSLSSFQMKAAPLLNLVAAVLKDQTSEPVLVYKICWDRAVFSESKKLQLQNYVNEKWSDVTAMLYGNDAVWREGLASSTSSNFDVNRTIESLRNQLQEAHEARNPGAVVSIWKKLISHVETTPSFVEHLSESTEFLDEWIFVWCATRRGEKVQATLDLMQRLMVRPTIRTYTNMMHGWKICKEGDKIDALWEKLQKSGMKLDAVIWTERISSLIELGKPQAGIGALAEMQALWKAATERGAPHTAVQPTIIVVNAAFKGLISLDRRAAFEVLEWAGREQIEPDVRTYNILLQQSFRNDPPDDIQNLLKAMNKHGIEPDEATFTLILEGVLKSMVRASAAEQVEAVQYVFDEIKLSGLKPNAQTYGKMLYAVAEFTNGADETIDAVLKRMQEDGLSITPHMVTILIERSLRHGTNRQQGLAGIRRLLDAHGFTSIDEGDQTLWERVMSAYAVLGDTAGALAIYDNLTKLGRPVTSLACLSDILRALLADKEMDAARRVAQSVLKYRIRNSEGPSDARHWHHRFWHLAKDHGLLKAEDIPAQIRTWMGEKKVSRNR